MVKQTYERWVYRDGPTTGENTCYLIADKPDWFRAESRFGLKLVKHFKDLTAEQVGNLYVEAIKFRGPENKLVKRLEQILKQK